MYIPILITDGNDWTLNATDITIKITILLFILKINRLEGYTVNKLSIISLYNDYSGY